MEFDQNRAAKPFSVTLLDIFRDIGLTRQDINQK